MSGFRAGLEAAIPALRRYARALTHDAELADDLVQDTLVRALRSEHLFHGGDLRSWLYTILTNLNRNRLRSLARRPAHSPIEDNDAPDLAGPEAGGRDIERALASLVEDQRSALLLGGARRADLSRGRRDPGRADRHRDVAACARPHADQVLSRRRASGAAPGEVKQWASNEKQETKQ